MQRTTNPKDIGGEIPSRYNEPLLDRLDYCRGVLFAHGLITKDEEERIRQEVADREERVEEEAEYFAAKEAARPESET